MHVLDHILLRHHAHKPPEEGGGTGCTIDGEREQWRGVCQPQQHNQERKRKEKCWCWWLVLVLVLVLLLTLRV